ncbi:MAG: response regulator [Elusimicrobiota bacterium]|nr:response regulator [Elusimicrobiota bacterium]
MSERPLILIIDDEHDFRVICAHVLERGGYDTATAADGAAGLAAFAERRPDLVVLDGNLPDLDGIEVCRRLRKLPGGGAVPVLMCTVRSAVVSISEGLDAGVTDYVLKPFEMEDLLARVAGALKKAPR